jgi:hypothetical protein
VYPPPDCPKVIKFFHRRRRESDNQLANRYAAFLYVLFRAAKLLFAPLVALGLDYGKLSLAWYQFLDLEKREYMPEPSLQRKGLYTAVVNEAEVRSLQWQHFCRPNDFFQAVLQRIGNPPKPECAVAREFSGLSEPLPLPQAFH